MVLVDVHEELGNAVEHSGAGRARKQVLFAAFVRAVLIAVGAVVANVDFQLLDAISLAVGLGHWLFSVFAAAVLLIFVFG